MCLGDRVFVGNRQTFEGFVHLDDVDVSMADGFQDVVDDHRTLSSAPFGGLPFASVIHKHAPHLLGRDGKEVRAILPTHLPLIHEA